MAFEKDKYDVVLVYPPARAILEVYDLPDFPNIGIAYIGNYLKSHTGIVPALIDAKFSRLSIEETVAEIVRLQPKVVGFGAMTPMVTVAAEVMALVKEQLGDVVTVLGGFHATFMPGRTLREFPSIDYVVVGEGEMAFSSLVKALVDGRPVPNIQGLWRRRDGDIVNAGRAEIPETLDELGSPGWDLYDAAEMEEFCESLPVMGQRGCPFSCTFCSRPYGQSVRKRTPALIADEIKDDIEKYGVRNIHFYDETFSVDRKHTSELCEELIRRNVPKNAQWTATVHANTIDLELATLMKSAGCGFAGYGVETGDEDIMAQMKKGVNKDRLLKAREVLKCAGITTSGYFMLGHPNESRRSVFKTIAFAVKLNPDVAAIGIMVPYPGTQIWELATKGEGGYKKLSVNWDDFNKQLGNAVELESIHRREIEFYQLVGYASLYVFNLRFGDLFRVMRDNMKLLLSVVAKIVLPKKTLNTFVLFRNDGGRVWKAKKNSYLMKS